MSIRNLFLYLFAGNRQAILDLAADRRALWVGLVFVLSAGFAREYDGQYLLREPWHLLIPVGASLGAASLLFLVVCGPLFLRRTRPPFLSAFRSFLTLFWLTAPLAWLYAIPYERFLSSAAATEANLWTLALVAAWRVLLMTRVVSVLTDRTLLTSFVMVMLFADAVALTAVILMPKPVVGIMGGVRHTESEQVISEVSFLVLGLGFLSAPVWLIGGLIGALTGRPRWAVSPDPPPKCSGRGVWVLAAASLLVWLPILPWTQSEQALRWQAEQALKGGRIEEGLDIMSAHARSDFPPQWDPPPRVGYGEHNPDLFEVMYVVLTREPAPWVRDYYTDKFRDYIGDPYGWTLGRHQGPELVRLVRVIERLPDGPEIAAGYAEGAKYRLSEPGLSAEDRETLTALLSLADKAKKPDPGANP